MRTDILGHRIGGMRVGLKAGPWRLSERKRGCGLSRKCYTSARMSRLLLVSLGGAIGSGARYLVSTWTHAVFGAAFPWGTLVVNVLGSFSICAVMHLAIVEDVIPSTLRLFLTTGIMGGFTTYSAFNQETFGYAQRGAYLMAALNVGLTLVLCFGAGVAGDFVARALVRG
jgi:CrcB protein